MIYLLLRDEIHHIFTETITILLLHGGKSHAILGAKED